MQQMKVTFDGEQHDFQPPKLGDLVAFERTFGVKANVLEPKPVLDENGAQVLDEKTGEPVSQADVALEWMAFLIWRSFRRSGVITKDTAFDEDFIDLIEEIQTVDDDDKEDGDADPSVSAPQPG